MANNPNNQDNLKPFKAGEDDRRNMKGRPPRKFLTELLIKESKKKKEIVVEGEEMVNGRETGRKVKIKIKMPTKELIVQAHLRECAAGNMQAIKEYYDRVEGKTVQGLELTGKGGGPIESETESTVLILPSNGHEIDSPNDEED